MYIAARALCEKQQRETRHHFGLWVGIAAIAALVAWRLI